MFETKYLGYSSIPAYRNEYRTFNTFRELMMWVEEDNHTRFPFVGSMPFDSIGDLLWLKMFSPLNIIRDGKVAGIVFQSGTKIHTPYSSENIEDFVRTSDTQMTQLYWDSIERNIPIFINSFVVDKKLALDEKLDYRNIYGANFYRFICENNNSARQEPRFMQIFDRSILDEGKIFEERFGIDYSKFLEYKSSLLNLGGL